MELYSEENLRQFMALKLRFMHNAKGFFEKYRFYLYLLVIAAFLDSVSTTHFMLLFSPSSEAHPLVREISLVFGPVFGPLLGKVAQILPGIIIAVIVRKYAGLIFSTAIILYLFAAWYNIYITTGFSSFLMK